ncbi:MAG: efflux RND transporter periplasmic adaptor subunit [Bacteroidales bacterium]|nr:efflux RND transporter periplasmic adaptor subunit [Bacteroidales bacterium]
MKKYWWVMVMVPLAVGCGRLQSSEEAGERVVNVGVVRIGETHASGAMAEYVGNVEGAATVDVSFGTVGRVATLRVKEGDKVTKGQLLATIDNAAAASSYEAAKATLERAEDGYRRAKMVYDKGSLPEVKWIEVQTQLNQARSLCDVAQKNVTDCMLRAPMSATVGKRYVEPGATVSPMQPVVRLIDMTQMCVRMSVPEADIAYIAKGDTVDVTVNAADSLQLKGVVDEKDISADAVSHSYLVRVRLVASKEEMKRVLPGMVCRVRMSGSASHQEEATGGTRLMVPNRAVQIGNDGQRYVWKVVDSNRVERCAVTIGDLTANGVLVTKGLEKGDIVVTDGTQKIASGSVVNFNFEF